MTSLFGGGLPQRVKLRDDDETERSTSNRKRLGALLSKARLTRVVGSSPSLDDSIVSGEDNADTDLNDEITVNSQSMAPQPSKYSESNITKNRSTAISTTTTAFSSLPANILDANTNQLAQSTLHSDDTNAFSATFSTAFPTASTSVSKQAKEEHNEGQDPLWKTCRPNTTPFLLQEGKQQSASTAREPSHAMSLILNSAVLPSVGSENMKDYFQNSSAGDQEEQAEEMISPGLNFFQSPVTSCKKKRDRVVALQLSQVPELGHDEEGDEQLLSPISKRHPGTSVLRNHLVWK